jgi:hypothetical protein
MKWWATVSLYHKCPRQKLRKTEKIPVITTDIRVKDTATVRQHLDLNSGYESITRDFSYIRKHFSQCFVTDGFNYYFCALILFPLDNESICKKINVSYRA